MIMSCAVPHRLLLLRRIVRCLRGVYALRYWRGHLGLMRVMAHPGLIGAVSRRPRLLFKYLHRTYLAVGLDSACRLAILTHHYAFLLRSFRAPFLRTHLAQGLVLWQLPGDPAALKITLTFSNHDLEGELMLALWTGEDSIYTASLTLAHGAALGAGHAPVVLITGLQGALGKLPLIRHATLACAETAPSYLLLAAVKGMAAVLGMERIVGVGNARQLAKAAGRALFDYDRFWASLGGVPTNDGFFQIPVHLPEQAPSSCPSKNRRREARKRDFKRGVAEAVAQRLRQAMSTPPTPTY
jgi:uncharacterized protein VirK/YbjX